MKNKKGRSINSTFYSAYIFPGIIIFLFLAASIVLALLYINIKDMLYIYILIGVDVVLVGLYIFACSYNMRKLNKYYVEGLYGNTSLLLEQLKNNSKDFTRYPKTNIKELNELNDELDIVSSEFENATLISNTFQVSHIPLEYVGEDKEFVTLASLKKYLRPLIYSAQNFRNALCEIFYDFDDDALEEDEQKTVLAQIKNMMSDYEYRLFALNEDKSGYYIYLPHIESFNHVRDLVFNYTKKLSVSKKTYDGIAMINARFSLVCYPYSDIDDLFSDLKYAKRQGETINIYLPNRLDMLGHSKLVQNSMNLNNVSRILESLSDLRISSNERMNSLNTVKKALSAFTSYLDIDYTGIFILNDDDHKYYSAIDVSKTKGIFPEGMEIPKDFIDAFDTAVDEDCSYYFSARSHCNVHLAMHLDKMNLASGFYFVSRDRGAPYAVIYFFNQNRPFIINSYLREGLFLATHRIGDFILMVRRETHFNNTYREIEAMLLNNNSALYRIDSETHNIVSFSKDFKTLFKDAKIGVKCYKVTQGKDYPCDDCPLVTSQKKYGEIDGTKYYSSLSINDREAKLKRLLIQIIKDEDSVYDRFDNELLIASLPSLAIALRGLYSINARGYLLVLRIDNHHELLEDLGSEKYLFLLRQFITKVKELNKDRELIYSFDNQSLALLLAETGQIDVVNLVEQIYEVSKKEFTVGDKGYSFNITYLPYSFPQQFPIAEDFLKYVTRHYNQRNYEINKDILFFPDGDYSRSASRNKFMLSVIDEQFGNKTFSVALQPMLRAVDKSIYGAEIFIRLSDTYRNMVFSADELIKTAAKNGKISLISNALIKYIGELYGQFGLTVFKVYGFNRLSINTDYSYFADPHFHEEIHKMLVDFHFPRDFLGFEITEREISNHLDEFKKLAKDILNEHIVLICDQYTGKTLSIETLKKIGFTEIKIDRLLVRDMEVNPQHKTEVISIIKDAEAQGVKASLVGVENADQFIIIRDTSKNTYVQGYHFYRPLDKAKFIEELRKNK